MKKKYKIFVFSIITIALLTSVALTKEKSTEKKNPPKKPSPKILSSKLSPEKKSYKVGEIPELHVKIKNLSQKSVYLVGSLDASDCRWRYPHCFFKITGPQGNLIVKGAARCRNMDPLKKSDFVLLKAKEKFNPYQQGFFPSYQINQSTFQEPGEYKISFVYSTESEELKAWTTPWHREGNEEELLGLLKQVPKLMVESNTVIVEILD